MGWVRRVALLGWVCGLVGLGAAQTGGTQTNGTAKDGACAKGDGSKMGAVKAGGESKGCPAAEHVPSVTEQFPFPGEAPVAAPRDGTGQTGGSGVTGSTADRFPYPGESAPEAPKAADGKGKAGSAGDRFPYPGERPSGAADAGSSSSSSSSSSGDPADGKPDLKDEGSEGEVKPHRRRLRAQAQKTLSDNERVEEDLSVAHYYQQSGNTMGAYLRAKDAVKLQPDAGDTHLALAEAADRLGKRDEAIAEYTAALAGDLDDDGAKAAKKGLARLKR